MRRAGPGPFRTSRSLTYTRPIPPSEYPSLPIVRDAEGALKGWYCDITRPAVVSGTELVVEDLDLDLWRSADGTAVLRLDEDEFAASGLATTDPVAAAAAENALAELELLARKGDFESLLT